MGGWFSVQLSISGPTNGIFILVPKLEGNDETEKKNVITFAESMITVLADFRD